MFNRHDPYSRRVNWLYMIGLILACQYACTPHYSFKTAPFQAVYAVYDVRVASLDGQKTVGPYKVALVSLPMAAPAIKKGLLFTTLTDLSGGLTDIVNTCAGDSRDEKAAGQYWCITDNGELCAHNARLEALQQGQTLTERIESYCELKTLRSASLTKEPAVTVKPVKMVTDKTPAAANATYTLLKSCEAEIVKTKRWVIGSKSSGVISLPTYISGEQYDLVKPSCFAPDDLVLAQPH